MAPRALNIEERNLTTRIRQDFFSLTLNCIHQTAEKCTSRFFVCLTLSMHYENAFKVSTGQGYLYLAVQFELTGYCLQFCFQNSCAVIFGKLTRKFIQKI